MSGVVLGISIKALRVRCICGLLWVGLVVGGEDLKSQSQDMKVSCLVENLLSCQPFCQLWKNGSPNPREREVLAAVLRIRQAPSACALPCFREDIRILQFTRANGAI